MPHGFGQRDIFQHLHHHIVEQVAAIVQRLRDRLPKHLAEGVFRDSDLGHDDGGVSRSTAPVVGGSRGASRADVVAVVKKPSQLDVLDVAVHDAVGE